MKRRTTAVSELTPAAISILLQGWGRTHPEGERDDDDGVFDLAGGWGQADPRPGDVVLPDDIPATDRPIARVWHRHTAFLRAEAKRLGLSPTFFVRGGQAVYYGEYCAVPWPERDWPQPGDDEDEATS